MKKIWVIAIFPSLLLNLLGQEGETAEPRRNPYLELGAFFEFNKTGDPLKDWNPNRKWTANDGRTLQARIVRVKDGAGEFLLADRKKAQIPLERLIPADQRFVAEWLQISRYFNTGYQKSRNAANQVQAGIGDGAFAREGKIHETRNFRFESDAPLNAATVKDFSRMFEATYNAVRTLPIALEVDTPVGGKFKVRLFADKKDYYSAGGPTTSAGVYILSSREILVPFESLGLKRIGKTYRKALASDPSTLVHEITHAVTHQWLNFMPMWVAEGLADYVAAIPYRNGIFNLNQHGDGIYRMVATNFGGDAMRFRILRPREFVFLSPEEYMAQPARPERLIELTAVQPYQITLLGKHPAKPSEPSSMAAESERTPEPSAVNISDIKQPVRNNPSSIVVQRYSSSMLLLDELISNGQVENLRKYLFANLHFQWESEKYIADYNQSLDEYQSSVKRQIDDFDRTLKDFNDSVHSYNAVVKLRNAGGNVELPPVPEDPAVPKPVKVPEILAKPRSSEAFSLKIFRRNAVAKYLEIPNSLNL